MKTAFQAALFLLIPAPASAATAIDTGSMLLRTAWALFVVLGLILVLYGFANRKFGLHPLKSGKIQIIEMRHIMPKTALALIQVKDREMLIGIGPGNIELLADLSEKDRKPINFDAVLAEEL